jgi:tetratricopeptide (TPR) repeat protein
MIQKIYLALTLFFLILGENCISQNTTISFTKYLSVKNKIEAIDSLIEKGNYKKALRKSFKLEVIPCAIKKSHYINIAECYIHEGDYSSARTYISKASQNGLIRKYFDYFKMSHLEASLNGDNFSDLILKDYDSIIGAVKDSNYRKLESEILTMINKDQGIRRDYSKVFHIATKETKDSFLAEMKRIDYINKNIYDSISEVHGWVRRDMILNSFRNPHIVLYHSKKEAHYKYIHKGFELATQNKINWYDVISIQSYAIGRDANINRDTFSTIPLVDFSQDYRKSEKYRFLCYAFSQELTDGGSFSESGKMIQLYLVHNENSMSDKYIFQLLKRFKKDIVKHGVSKEKVVIDLADFSRLVEERKTNLGIRIISH